MHSGLAYSASSLFLRTAASSPRRSMSELANTFLFVFAGLFPVVNPLATAPIFLSLTTGCQESQRHSLALRVALNSFWLLLGSMLFGSLILEFFGITVPVVRVAGGTLITAMGCSTTPAIRNRRRS